MHSVSTAACMLFIVGVFPTSTRADFFDFTSRVAFDAFRAPDTELNFDELADGTIVSSGTSAGGIIFNYDFSGFNVMATSAFDAPSGNISLGTDDGGNAFQDGDDVQFAFSARHGFGLYIISADTLLDNDFRLTVGGATAFLDTSDLINTLSDGGNVYFLGIQGDANSSFTAARLIADSGAPVAFTFNIDNIVSSSVTAVPEPSSLLLTALISGITTWRTLRRRREKNALHGS